MENTIKVFRYQSLASMQPRPGKLYATRYYKQSEKQRKEQAVWILEKIIVLDDMISKNPQLEQAQNWPLQGFPKENKKQPNRSLKELLLDMIGEIMGLKRNGDPKDFAEAPITRWNKFFSDTEFAFELQEGMSTRFETNFTELFGVARERN